MIDFTSIQQMLESADASHLPLWDAIRRSDCQRQGIGPEESWQRMSAMLAAMTQADEGYRESDRSHSGLVGGDGGKMARYGRSHPVRPLPHRCDGGRPAYGRVQRLYEAHRGRPHCRGLRGAPSRSPALPAALRRP